MKPKKIRLLAADREEVKRTLLLAAHHRALANNFEADVQALLLRYGADITRDNWTLDTDLGVLTHDQADEAP